MKTINFLKAGAVLTATAVILSSSVSYLRYAQPYSKSENVSKVTKPVVTVLNNTTSSDPETANVEMLMNACNENNQDEIAEKCDFLLDSIEDSKKEFEETYRDVESWGNDELMKRLEKYETELKIKSAETEKALNEIKNGINIEENLEIINNNLYESDEYCYSDAVPNNEVSVDSINTVNASLVRESIEVFSPAPDNTDLDCSSVTKYGDKIKTIADEFEDVNSLYNFVKNNVKFENYSGSKKDPVITLDQFGGNDIDQSALLIALLRAKGIPARFVEGTVQITAEQAIAITGAETAEIAGRLLASYGRKTTGITNNGKLIGYKMNRVWVEAYIPYTDYRGAGNKKGESIWVQLDPAFKEIKASAEAIAPEFSESDNRILSAVQDMAEKCPNIVDASEYTVPETVDFHYRSIVQSESEYIPSTLPYTLLNVEERYKAVKDEDKDRISISINDEPLISIPVAELCYDQINVSYEPASDIDKDVMDRYEKITDVPAYIVNVVPVVTVGDKKYRGEYEETLGTNQQMVTTIKSGGSTTMLCDRVYCGSMYAINLDLQNISVNEAESAKNRMNEAYENFSVKNSCSTSELGTLLDYAGKYYFSICDSQALIYSGTMNINATRQLGFAITGYQFTRSSMFGTVRSLDTGSFYIDVAYNSVAAVSLEGDREAEKNYMMTVGTLESYFEGYIWEELIDNSKTCISTISVMKAANDAGISPRFICKANLDEELALCNVSNSVKSEVRNFVNQGHVIEIVPETLTIDDWTGTAYIAMNRNNGSASYMISGGNAGGSSMNFEDLFVMNNNMALINTEMSLCTLAIGSFKLQQSLATGNPFAIFGDVNSTIGAAFSLGSAMQMRYSNYDFIFDYAERGEDCMKDYMIFTMKNLMDTFVNVVSFIGTVTGLVAGEVGGIIEEATGWFATEYALFSMVAENFDGDDDYAGAMDVISLIWDLIGKLVAEIGK